MPTFLNFFPFSINGTGAVYLSRWKNKRISKHSQFSLRYIHMYMYLVFLRRKIYHQIAGNFLSPITTGFLLFLLMNFYFTLHRCKIKVILPPINPNFENQQIPCSLFDLRMLNERDLVKFSFLTSILVTCDRILIQMVKCWQKLLSFFRIFEYYQVIVSKCCG